MEITLFSSDSSGQYKKDIYNVIAAPYNSEYRFRYRAQYVDPALRQQLSENRLIGAKILIIFRTNSDKQDVKPFMVPIRWATVIKSYFSNEICIIEFKIKDYPEFSHEFKKASISKNSNNEYSKTFFAEGERNKQYVLKYIPNIVTWAKCDYERQEFLWISIIEALKHHEAFQETSFFRTLLPVSRKNKFPKSLVIKESQYKEIELWHFCSEETKQKTSEVSIQCDTNYINPVFGTKDKIECRYDRINYGFQAIKGKNNLKSQIVFKIIELNDKHELDFDSETKVCIPVTLKRNLARRFTRAFLTFLGSACIVAFSAFTASDSMCVPNLALAIMLIVGALAAPISWLISGEE